MAQEVESKHQEPELFEWQCRVHWELRSLDSIPADAKEVFIKGEEDDKFLARVALPSGKVLRVAASVLLHCCHALRAHESKLLSNIIHIDYFPDAMWSDDIVEHIFKDLRNEWSEPGYIEDTSMYPHFGALIDALDVPVAKSECLQIAECILKSTTMPMSSKRLFEWLGAYQLIDRDWKQHAIGHLALLSPVNLRKWMEGNNRKYLLEAFTHDDILTLAYSRWKGKYQVLPAVMNAASAKRVRPVGDTVLPRAKTIPPFLQLKLIISDDFSVLCDHTVMHDKSAFIRDAIVDEDGPVPTMHLPFAAAFPQSQVFEFFTNVDAGGKFTKSSPWKLSWVHLADHLQMTSVLDAAAEWIWGLCGIEHFREWLDVTRLHSMQQRRPLTTFNTLSASAEGMMLMLADPDVGCAALARILEHDREALVSELGLDRFLELVSIKRLL